MKHEIIIGDCLDSLAELPPDTFQTCITSPPYWGLRDYNVDGQLGMESTPDEFVGNLVRVLRLAKRVLRDDGTVWLNLGDSYYNYRPGAGQSMPKQTVSETSQDLPQVCARRGNKIEGLKEKDLIGIPWRAALALQADGWYLRQDIIWHKPNPMPEKNSLDRCHRAHEYIFLLSKSQSYYFDGAAITEATSICGERNKRSVWTCNTSRFSGAHFATFPPKLVEPCIKAGSRPGDKVLDPFGGAGTVGLVADRLGRDSTLLELNPEYAELARKRLIDDAPLLCEVKIL